MNHLEMARALFGLTLAYHIGYATIGVGTPLLIFIAEVVAALTKQQVYRIFAQRMVRIVLLLVGVGIVTGTTVAVMLSTLWPRFMQAAGQVINVPFEIEIFAFMLESLFLAIYVYGGDRLSTRMRIISPFFITLGSTASAILITDVNSFMNTPTGVTWVNGHPEHVNLLKAIFNPAFPTELLHVVLSAYMAVAFIMASVAAKNLLKDSLTSQERGYHRQTLSLTMIVGGITSVLTAFVGDLSGKFLAKFQPEKLAAAEGLFRSTTHAPLVIGGIPDPSRQDVVGGIPIPDMLSWLATERFDGKVIGLDAFPRATWPPLFVHLLFDTMVGIGSWCILIALVYWIYRVRTKTLEVPKWFLRVIFITGFLAMLGIEAGWCFAEFARQPWIIYNVMTVAQAVTPTANVGLMFFGYMSLYAVLLIGTVWALRRYFRNHPVFDNPPAEHRERRGHKRQEALV
ncbi:cytochrome ubiquinol oxidase subunit I [Alicyclobacillus herbarius]|uniref:cytochrome ubiquinol oxidase subunit I n=1 Tax=Alicyclobacillus herbarius TaxID=122960 RepID=UPI002357D4B9|nr:cytochrome ubiquinol oxidase subunit I [Alicyclobacillus herbarius]